MLKRSIALVCAGLVVVAGCSQSEAMVVPLDQGKAEMPTGATLEVGLGQVNSSVGDSWHLVDQPDSAVLKDLGSETDRKSDAPGSSGQMSWRFESVKPGKTTLGFQYCYRSSPPDCKGKDGKPAADPIKFAVTIG